MSHHSTDSELRHLWGGGLPSAQADRVIRHLSRCEGCLSRLIEIDAQLTEAELPGDSADESQAALLVR